jgi:plastocyanin
LTNFPIRGIVIAMEENTTPQASSSSKTMPIVIAVIAILALGGIAYALTQRNSTAPASQTTQEQTPAEESGAAPTGITDSETEDAMEETSEMSDDEEGAVKEFTITGKNFDFSDEEIRVQEGDRVKIVFSSTGGFHDWVVDEFDGAATEQVNPGKTTTAEFVADKKGEYEFYCSVGNHRGMGMVGKLIVE